jgi:hypothetical protein
MTQEKHVFVNLNDAMDIKDELVDNVSKWMF